MPEMGSSDVSPLSQIKRNRRVAESTAGTPGPNETNGSAGRTDTPKVLDELSRNNHSRRGAKRGKGFRRFIFIVLMLAPLVVALVWLMLQQFETRTEIAELREQNQQLQTQVDNLPPPTPPAPPVPQAPPQPQQIVGNFVEPQQLDRELRALRSAIESRINALYNGVSELQQRVANAPMPGAAAPAENEDWMWSEAEYQLRLANQKLQLEGDSESAALLLNSVNDILSRTEDPALLSVRRAIAEELLAVRSIEQVDTAGLYVRLDSLDNLVSQLSLRGALAENYNAQLASQRAAESSDQGFVARTLQLFRSIFVWQRWDDAPEALLPPQQEATLQQNLHLLLGQAQLALLMGEGEAYRSSLRKAADWTSTYFAIDSGTGRTLSEELGVLAGYNVVEQRPDISTSLETLRRYNDARQRGQNGN